MEVEEILKQDEYGGRFGPLKAAIDEADFLANSETDLAANGMRKGAALVRDLVAQFLLAEKLVARLSPEDPRAHRLHHPYLYGGLPDWLEGGADELFEIYHAAFEEAAARNYDGAQQAFKKVMEGYRAGAEDFVSPRNLSLMKGYMNRDDARQLALELVTALAAVPKNPPQKLR